MKRLTDLAVRAIAAGTLQAQTTWDMPTRYAPKVFHTLNIQQFADEAKQATAAAASTRTRTGLSIPRRRNPAVPSRPGQVNIVEF